MLSDAQRASLTSQMAAQQPGGSAASEELPPPIVVLQDCLIRPYHASDAEESAAQANNPKVVTYMSNGFPHPYTVADAHRWMELCARESPPLNFAICDRASNVFMGGVGLKAQPDIHERTVELGYWLGEAHWGRGLMGQVVRGFTDWVFAARPHVARIEALVIAGNEGSRRVLAKQGYALEGTLRRRVWKNGQLLDSYMYAVVREDWEATRGHGRA